MKEEVTAIFRASDRPKAFKAGLNERGYTLARGDRRDYVILDRKGGVHSLARCIDGIKAAELRKFMAPLDRDSVPTIEHARKVIEMLDPPSAELRPSPNEARVNPPYLNQYLDDDGTVNQSAPALLQAASERAAEQANEPIPSLGESPHSDEQEMAEPRPRHLDRSSGLGSAEQSRDPTEDHASRQPKALGDRHSEPIREAWARCLRLTRRALSSIGRLVRWLPFRHTAQSLTSR